MFPIGLKMTFNGRNMFAVMWPDYVYIISLYWYIVVYWRYIIYYTNFFSVMATTCLTSNPIIQHSPLYYVFCRLF